MAMRSGLHIHPADGIGTSAQDARMALAGLVAVAGVLDGMTVTGTAGWQYSVGRGHVATTRGMDADGVVVFTNDAPTLVDCTPSPGTGARIDIIYAKHNDAEAGDSDNLPVLSVAEGIASGTPNPPDLPTGAIELARVTVGAGATSTNHANVTISHATRARAKLRGGITTVANSEQMDAAWSDRTEGTVFAWREDAHTLSVAWGDGWKRVYPAETVAGERSGGATNSVSNSSYTVLSAGSNSDYTGGVIGGGGGLIVPVAGWYSVDAGIRWDANSTGYRIIRILVNGSVRTVDQTNAGGFTINTISRKLHLQAGDNVTLEGWQNSGGTLSTSASLGFPYMSVALVGSD